MGELAWPGARGFRVRGCAARGLRVRGSEPSAPDPLDSLAPTPWFATNQLTNKPAQLAQPAQPAQPAQQLPSSPISLFRGQKSPVCESPTPRRRRIQKMRSCDLVFCGNAATLLISQLESGSHIGRFLSKTSQFQERKRGDRLALAETLRKQSCSMVDEVQRQAS